MLNGLCWLVGITDNLRYNDIGYNDIRFITIHTLCNYLIILIIMIIGYNDIRFITIHILCRPTIVITKVVSSSNNENKFINIQRREMQVLKQESVTPPILTSQHSQVSQLSSIESSIVENAACRS